MKKVGFIDYFLDEFHANKYPALIKQFSEGEFEVTYAYGHIDSPRQGGKTNKEWAEQMGVTLLSTIDEVIEKSDVLIVLSPDNPEMHRELCDKPLRSGKLTYVDKTFAPDKKTAIELFDIAEKSGTPCYSSSAVRFSSELCDIDKSQIYRLYSNGNGDFDNYSIHQLEVIISLMEARAKKVMATSEDKTYPSIIIEFEDGRVAQMARHSAIFEVTYETKDCYPHHYPIQSKYFELFVKNLVEFFKTGVEQVPHSQTIDVIGVREAALKAFEAPFTWVEV